MDDDRLIKVSKFLSRYLRHEPERLGLTLQPGGWAGVDELLAACAEHRFPVTRGELDEVVARNNKRRYEIDPLGTKIRASQGHSVEVDLELEPTQPPPVLYHGTGHKTADAILMSGLLKMRRVHVHLSPDVATAKSVGMRHGRPVIFTVDAAAMHLDGHRFLVSSNGVWLVDHVPPKYLRRL